MKHRVGLAHGCLAIALGMAAMAAAPARADVIAPAGLAPGSTFQIVFVTSATTAATSTSISYYDNFVTTLADAAGLGTYEGGTVTWDVLGSTAAVSAISREPVTGTAPIYLVNGTEVAASAAALWNAGQTALLSAINVNELGTKSVIGSDVWTGTAPNGITNAGDPLGGSSVAIGLSNSITKNWIGSAIAPDTNSYNVYGVSEILTVPVPEPASTATLCIGTAGLWAVRRRRKAGAAAPLLAVTA